MFRTNLLFKINPGYVRSIQGLSTISLKNTSNPDIKDEVYMFVIL